MLPHLSIRHKNAVTNPTRISFLPDTFDAEILEVCRIYCLDVLGVTGVDYGGGEDVGLECFAVVAEKGLKSYSVVTFGSACGGFSVEVEAEDGIFVIVFDGAAAIVAFHQATVMDG